MFVSSNFKQNKNKCLELLTEWLLVTPWKGIEGFCIFSDAKFALPSY